MADPEIVNPTTLARPNGYSHGVLFPAGGRVLFVAGQVAWDAEGQLVGQDDFVAQFRCALANALAVVRAAGGGPESVGRFTIYVTDRRGYLANTQEIGQVYRELMGRHYPAMVLVQVAALLERGALLEIEATAIV